MIILSSAEPSLKKKKGILNKLINNLIEYRILSEFELQFFNADFYKCKFFENNLKITLKGPKPPEYVNNKFKNLKNAKYFFVDLICM